ncbi:DUF6765 family protein [uncultured Fibrobacter sp.]|uniref:DUF6765 family protein n=1 Tax=uncultured Fibrobacter sp. TaxID=261512 RepID=UPI00261DAA1A|nr:DUF6765 family protein [uncultured Fibrobacter sp.]
MNLDSHYYGTYFIARQAGWSNEDACKIAWAAETVDQAYLTELSKLYKTKNSDAEKKNVARVTTILDPWDDMRKTKTFTYAYRYWIMFSWMPFHFLPEIPSKTLDIPELESNVEFKKLNDSERAHAKLSENIYKEDFLQICKTSTNLCKEMIEKAKSVYNEIMNYIKQNLQSTNDEYTPDANQIQAYCERKRDEALFRIGICMHVLADTWSHQGFCGNGDVFINNVNVTKKNEYTDEDGTKMWLGDAFAVSDCHVFSTYWAGHGTALHNPDIPAMDYKYKHPYSNIEIHANNVDRFLKAFYQMYVSLRYICNDENNFTLDENSDKLKNIKLQQKNENLYNILEKIFKNSKKYEDKDEENKCTEWKNVLREMYGENNYCPKYCLTESNSYKKLEIFLHPAEDHRNFIMEKMGYENKIPVITKIIDSLVNGSSINDIKMDSDGNELKNADENNVIRVDVTDFDDKLTSYFAKEMKKFDAVKVDVTDFNGISTSYFAKEMKKSDAVKVDITDFNGISTSYFAKKVNTKETNAQVYYLASADDIPDTDSNPSSSPSTEASAVALNDGSSTDSNPSNGGSSTVASNGEANSSSNGSNNGGNVTIASNSYNSGVYDYNPIGDFHYNLGPNCKGDSRNA